MLDWPVSTPEPTTVVMDRKGNVYLDTRRPTSRLDGLADELLDLVAPFSSHIGSLGPDLHQPRNDVRLVPSKLTGSPHIVGTRLETRALAALAREGYDTDSIAVLYPHIGTEQIAQALDLEQQLTRNLSVPRQHDTC